MTNGFPSFPKIPRLHKDVVITEKLDGTNGLISVEELPGKPDSLLYGETSAEVDGKWYAVRAGSRNRWLTLTEDNHGFARWVHENADELVKLGPGHHYGEWFGQGIQRGYGLTEKRFALFNVARWTDLNVHPDYAYRGEPLFPKAVPCPKVCTVVPTLWIGSADLLNDMVSVIADAMLTVGSCAVPGYSRPEGLIVYHVAAGQYFKVLFEGDNTPKSLKAAA